MLILYSLLGMMLLCALALLAIPFAMQRNLFSLSFLSLFLGMIVISLSVYQFSGNKGALIRWLTLGKSHYDLMEQFEKLGGVDGAIRKIEQKLKNDPNDPEGWTILGKLYLSKNEDKKAKAAFDRALAENAASGKPPGINLN